MAFDSLTERELDIVETAVLNLLEDADRELIKMEDEIYEGHFVDEADLFDQSTYLSEIENVYFAVEDEIDYRWADEDYYAFGEDDEFDLWGLDEIVEWDDEYEDLYDEDFEEVSL